MEQTISPFQAQAAMAVPGTTHAMHVMCTCGSRWGAHLGALCPTGDRTFILAAERTPTLDALANTAEPKRPRLTWADSKPTDRWEGFTVKSNTGPKVEADNSPFTRLGDSSNPLFGSAFLAVKG